MKIMILNMIIVLLTFSPVFAQDAPRTGNITFYASEAEIDYFGAYASEIINRTVYAAEQEVPETVTEVPDDWENVGRVNDLIMNGNWDVKAAVIDIGGFLGVFAHTIAVDVDSVQVVWFGEELRENTSGEVQNHISFVLHGGELVEFFLVIQATREKLENAPEFVGRGW